ADTTADITPKAAELADSTSTSHEYSLAPRPDESPRQSLRLAGQFFQSVWGWLQGLGIVLFVLIFVLFEHDSLRDRFIRLVGASDIRSATVALNDAGERLSRFFVSQFAVNLAFGTAIWMSLGLIHVPQAMLWGTLAGTMRFLPYIGAAITAILAAAF